VLTRSLLVVLFSEQIRFFRSRRLLFRFVRFSEQISKFSTEALGSAQFLRFFGNKSLRAAEKRFPNELISSEPVPKKIQPMGSSIRMVPTRVHRLDTGLTHLTTSPHDKEVTHETAL
jgi:hypothetical protein